MVRPLAIALAVALPLLVGFAVLANNTELGRGLTLALFVLVIAVPALLGVHLDDKRRHPPRRHVPQR